jgi:hypothetical protein
MAYAKMQFVDMADEERAFYLNALLWYCEPEYPGDGGMIICWIR